MNENIKYGDMCQECAEQDRYDIHEPLETEAYDSSHITATYCCNYGHQWKCRWAKQAAA